MPTKRLVAADTDDDTIIVVPIPLAVAREIGCHPNAVVHLHSVEGKLQVIPYTSQTINQTAPATVSTIWESCSRWWAERGPKAGNAVRIKT